MHILISSSWLRISWQPLNKFRPALGVRTHLKCLTIFFLDFVIESHQWDCWMGRKGIGYHRTLEIANPVI
jgi:hypothetical protein